MKKRTIAIGAVILLILWVTFLWLKEQPEASDEAGKVTEEAKEERPEAKIVDLTFIPYQVQGEIMAITLEMIDEKVLEKNLQGADWFVFKKVDDTENLHAGVLLQDTYYDLGPVSMMSAQDLTSISEVSLDIFDFVKITGVLGANYGQTSYYIADEEGLALFLRMDGVGLEEDLNDDGELEVVTSTGTLAQTFIYRIHGNEVTYADVNKDLGVAVVLVNKGVIEAYGENSSVTKYRLNKTYQLEEIQ